MSDLNTGKASTQFQEKAKELGNSNILDINQKKIFKAMTDFFCNIYP